MKKIFYIPASSDFQRISLSPNYRRKFVVITSICMAIIIFKAYPADLFIIFPFSIVYGLGLYFIKHYAGLYISKEELIYRTISSSIATKDFDLKWSDISSFDIANNCIRIKLYGQPSFITAHSIKNELDVSLPELLEMLNSQKVKLST